MRGKKRERERAFLVLAKKKEKKNKESFFCVLFRGKPNVIIDVLRERNFQFYFFRNLSGKKTLCANKTI